MAVRMTKVTKAKARQAFEQGREVYFMPSKLSPEFCAWFRPHELKKDAEHDDFDKLYNAFKYYNCNEETGNRVACYVLM